MHQTKRENKANYCRIKNHTTQSPHYIALLHTQSKFIFTQKSNPTKPNQNLPWPLHYSYHLPAAKPLSSTPQLGQPPASCSHKRR